MKHRSALICGLAAAALAAPAAADAALKARSDAGADVLSVTDTRDAIRGDIGTNPQTIGWDGVAAAQSAPNPMPPDQFLNARGVVFSTPGTGFEVSSPDDSGLPLEFGNVDAQYPNFFLPFSGDQIFRAVGSPVTVVDFFLPGTQTRATTNGFAVAFTDVDLSSSAKVEAFDSRGRLLGTSFAPPADNGLSFASLVADEGSPIAQVRITSGTTPLGPGVFDALPNVDVVAMDDFIFGPTQAASDLAVTVADAPDPATAGGELTYTVTVQNAGAGAAPTADLIAWLPAGVAAVSATPSQGTCATPTSCALGALAAGASATVTITARATSAGAAAASFTATTSNDPVAANDTATATTDVRPADTVGRKVVVRTQQVTVPNNGNVVLRLACPAAETRCTGTVRMTTKLLTIGGRKLRLELGERSFRIDGGQARNATIQLRRPERALLKALKRMRVDVVVQAADASGNRSTTKKAIWLKAQARR